MYIYYACSSITYLLLLSSYLSCYATFDMLFQAETISYKEEKGGKEKRQNIKLDYNIYSLCQCENQMKTKLDF